MCAFVYMWTNVINGKKYIGSHVGNPNDGYVGSGVIFKRALNKYGIDNFERVILEEVEDKKNILQREQYYLDIHDAVNDKSYYNVKRTAGGGWEYINESPIHSKANSDRFKNLWKYMPHPKGHLGKTHTEETKARIAASSKAASYKKTYNTPRPVLQFDLYGNFITRHDSLTDAAKFVNGRPSNIKYTIEGKFKKAYNYLWKYDEGNEK